MQIKLLICELFQNCAAFWSFYAVCREGNMTLVCTTETVDSSYLGYVGDY